MAATPPSPPYRREANDMSVLNRAHVISTKIPNGESLSGEIDLSFARRIAIEMPAVWTAADLTFQAASASGGTFKDVYDDAGTEVTVKASAGQVVSLLNAQKLSALRYVKIRSGKTGAVVAQAAERALNVIIKD